MLQFVNSLFLFRYVLMADLALNVGYYLTEARTCVALFVCVCVCVRACVWVVMVMVAVVVDASNIMTDGKPATAQIE